MLILSETKNDTCMSLSLGVPFWFDLLYKLMKLLGSAETPTSDKKEKQQS